MQTLYLYTTLGCHLCDLAEQLLEPLLSTPPPNSQAFVLQLVEIADDAELMECYGVRIPVLVCAQSGKELAWPFDQHAAADFLSSLAAHG